LKEFNEFVKKIEEEAEKPRSRLEFGEKNIVIYDKATDLEYEIEKIESDHDTIYLYFERIW
jgi:hypothetical protein